MKKAKNIIIVPLFTIITILNHDCGLSNFLVEATNEKESPKSQNQARTLGARGKKKNKYIWTKSGLEQIKWENWKYFEDDQQMSSSSLYLKSFPFPGDAFTFDHLNAWVANVDEDGTFGKLLKSGFIAKSKDKKSVMKVYDDYKKVPTLFTDPIVLHETPIDYRMQFAADIGSNMIGESAARGRLVNPAGRRLREHFYRFPDQCDATPIALEVFLRLMM